VAAHAEAYAGMAESPEDRVAAVQELAWCLDTAGLDPDLGEAEREALCEQYAAVAVAVLRAAVEAGLDPASLRRPELWALRDREDFQELLARAPR
jgi:hypothetical protein